MSTRTTPTHMVDVRALDLVLPALTGLPGDVLNDHLKRREPVHRAIREVLGSTKLDKVDWEQFHQLLYGQETVSPLVLPAARLAQNEPIRKLFPQGWYMVCPEGVDLNDLHQQAGQFSTKFYNTWFLNSYGTWPETDVERIPTTACEIFIPDPKDWLLPGSKGKTREKIIQMGEEWSKSLPEDWVWEEPSGETLSLAAFNYHLQTNRYPLSGYNYARCRNRYGSESCLSGGGFYPSSFSLYSWHADDGHSLGGLRWSVRYTKVGKKST